MRASQLIQCPAGSMGIRLKSVSGQNNGSGSSAAAHDDTAAQTSAALRAEVPLLTMEQLRVITALVNQRAAEARRMSTLTTAMLLAVSEQSTPTFAATSLEYQAALQRCKAVQRAIFSALSAFRRERSQRNSGSSHESPGYDGCESCRAVHEYKVGVDGTTSAATCHTADTVQQCVPSGHCLDE